MRLDLLEQIAAPGLVRRVDVASGPSLIQRRTVPVVLLTVGMLLASGRQSMPRARRGWCERMVGQGNEVEAVAAVVGDLDEDTPVVGLDDRADGSGGPSARLSAQLDDVEYLMFGVGHRAHSLAAIQGMSTQVEVRRGGVLPSISQVVTTGALAPLRPSIVTTTS